MATRETFNSGAKWEPIVGYSRALRLGDLIEVSGTVSVDDKGNPVEIGDAYGQTVRILSIIQHAIEELGGSLADVVRTRIYVTDISQWESIGRAHGEYFRLIRPVTSMIQVSKLLAPEYLVEIEATAVVGD